jgi:hypothetical protein
VPNVATLAELTEVMHTTRRIAALLLLQPALDANYRAVKAAAFLWPQLPAPRM